MPEFNQPYTVDMQEESPESVRSPVVSPAAKTGLPEHIKGKKKDIEKWTVDQWKASLAAREYLERMWMRVDSYMAGFHFFKIDNTGTWKPIPKKTGEKRAFVPMMVKHYRTELGRFTENVLTVQSEPVNPANPGSFGLARTAASTINTWHDEADVPQVWEDWSSQQIHYGLSALYRYSDPFRKQVYAEAWPAKQLHPIPWDASNDCQLKGFMRVTRMTKSWVAEVIGQHATDKAKGNKSDGVRIGSPAFGASMADAWAGMDSESAVVKWVWMLPTATYPNGQKWLMVEDEMFAYDDGPGALRDGKLPVKFSRYSRREGGWYGMGMLPTLLGPQGQADIEYTRIVRDSKLNNGILFYDDEIISKTDMEGDIQLIPYDRGAYSDALEGSFFHHVPGVPANRDVGVSLNLAESFANSAAGHESELLFGRSEGRVESGPAQRMLNVNAQAPIAPTLSHMARKLVELYSEVLDMIPDVWPEGRQIVVQGQGNLANEIKFKRQGFPKSSQVKFRIGPLVPAGRLEMSNMLFQLRSLPTEEGRPELSSMEFRRGLQMLGMSPPGMTIISPEDERIQQFVIELYNDGQQPGQLFTHPSDVETMKFENLAKLGTALKDKMLEPGFRQVTSPQVKKAFFEILQKLMEFRSPDPNAGDGFDENLDAQAFDARKSEEFMDAVEQNPENLDGHLTFDGSLVGV